MKKKALNILAMLIFSHFSSGFYILGQGQTFNLKEYWDSEKVCANPHKGLYHHLYSNSEYNYPPKNDSDLPKIPGLDHLYLRLSWNHFEPEEGKYDWHLVDDAVEKWVPRGLGLSFRITCKETTEEYATPEWVRLAGAKGYFANTFGKKIWVPDYGDSIFLAKLTAFHKAFAARYNGKPWFVYMDIGSIGTWGEGHEYPVPESDNRTWADGQSTSEIYHINIPESLKTGTYRVSFRLHDTLTGRNVELALKDQLRDKQGFYWFGKVLQIK